AGIGDFNAPLRQLIQTALVLYASPGSTMHELWTGRTGAASAYTYNGLQASEGIQLTGIPAALALADPNVRLPPLTVARENEDPVAVEEQAPSRLVQGLWTTIRWAEGRSVRIGKTTGTIVKQDQKALAKQVGGEEWAA